MQTGGWIDMNIQSLTDLTVSKRSGTSYQISFAVSCMFFFTKPNETWQSCLVKKILSPAEI